MMIKAKSFRKIILLALFFAICFSVGLEFNSAQNEDDLSEARKLIGDRKFDKASSKLNSFISKLTGNNERKRELSEAYYLLATVYYRIGEDSKVYENLKMAFLINPDLKMEESDLYFGDREKEIRKQLAEYFYLQAKSCYMRRGVEDKEVVNNLKLTFTICPDFSREETDLNFSRKVEQIRKEVKNSIKKTDVQEKGMKVVFIVDVSSSLRNHGQMIIDFVGGLIDSFEDIENKEYHLVTFCEEPKFFNPEKLDKSSILKEIDYEIARNKHKSFTYPLYALIQSFELIENNFPQKVGIVIFISDGEDSRYEYDERYKHIRKTEFRKAHDDLGQVIIAIKKVGFTVYNVFIDTGNERYMCEDCMDMLAQLSGPELIKVKFDSDNDKYKLDSDNDKYKSEIRNKVNLLKNKIKNANFISPAPRVEVNMMKKEWEEKKGKLENQVKYTGNKLSVLLFLIGLFLIGILFLGIWIRTRWKRREEEEKKKKEEEKREDELKLNMLWGKLIDPQKQVIDLSDKAPGFKLEPAKNKKFPTLEFQPANCKGKKAIKINCEVGRIKFLKNDKKKETGNHYIDMETCYFKVFPSKRSKSNEYDYIFLNKLSESCKNPVWETDEFKGRQALLDEIKGNFLKEGGDCYHYLISGMGNAGKTSLMNHLYYISLGEDDMIKQKYRLAMVEFKPKYYTTFASLEAIITAQLNSSKSGKKNLILIDEYDSLFERYPVEFGDLIKKNSGTFDYFFILSGRKGRELLERRYVDLLPPYMIHKKLEGLDDIESNIEKTYEKSLELINYLISDIGLPKSVLAEDIKCKIALYASGFPSIIKRILKELIIYWLSNYNEKAIHLEHVEKAFDVFKSNIKDSLLRRACEYDERNYANLPAPLATEVRIRDILNILSERFKGNAPKEEIKNILTRDPGGDPEIEDGRKESFDRKIEQLKDMGIIKESKEFFKGIPYMFFYGGGKIIEK